MLFRVKESLVIIVAVTLLLIPVVDVVQKIL